MTYFQLHIYIYIYLVSDIYLGGCVPMLEIYFEMHPKNMFLMDGQKDGQMDRYVVVYKNVNGRIQVMGIRMFTGKFFNFTVCIKIFTLNIRKISFRTVLQPK